MLALPLSVSPLMVEVDDPPADELEASPPLPLSGILLGPCQPGLVLSLRARAVVGRRAVQPRACVPWSVGRGVTRALYGRSWLLRCL